MAYRRKTKSTRKSYGRKSSYRRVVPKKRAAPKRRKATNRRAAAKPQRITLVIQHAPVTPTLATPQTRAAPTRARFGG